MGGATCASSQISSFGYNVIIQVALSNRSLKGAGVLLSQTIKYFLEESTTILKRNVVLFVSAVFMESFCSGFNPSIESFFTIITTQIKK